MICDKTLALKKRYRYIFKITAKSVIRRGNLFYHLTSANQSRYMRHFFCPMHSHAYVMAVYSGQSRDWPLLVRAVFPPLLRLPPFRGKNGGRFATNLQEEYHMKHHAIEHTPVYDLDAHHQRQRQRIFSKIAKNTVDLLVFISVMLVCIYVFLL